MVMAALFPHHSHMPLERHEKKVGKKKGLQGETPGESRDEIKTRTAAQKVEQQEQRVKAQQRALLHAAPLNVHHMSTRQKSQTQSGASATAKPRTPSPSQSSSSGSPSSSSTSSSPSKRKDDEQERKEVPKEQPIAQDPPPQEPEPAKPPSVLYRLARRLSQKTTVDLPVPPSKEAQETMEMPPPDLPRPKPLETPPVDPPREHASGASSYESVEEPDEAETFSSKRRRSWASLTPSAVSEDEMGKESVDLQSHDPRPASVAMLGWAQGFGRSWMCLFRDVPPQRREMLNSVICPARPLTDVSLKSCCSYAGPCLQVTSLLLSASAVLSSLHFLAACKTTKSLARSYASTGPCRLDAAGEPHL